VTENEAELIKRAQAADTDAFCELAGRYERRIYSLALHYSHDPQDAEDLSQEVWLKAYQAIGTFRGESGFYTWIRRITINCFLNRQRTSLFRLRKETGQLTDVQAASEQTAIPVFNVESALNNRILVANVMRALAQLTPRQRLIFLLKHHEGMTYEEIAAAVGCSTGTAKKAVARALWKLREQLDVEVPPAECVPCAAGEY
jgi:RNA polymerase sigma-70 factor (ECF subfamily)